MKTLLSLLLLLLLSCATRPGETATMLNSRLGQMNYEEALQRFGPPSNATNYGDTRTATWVQGNPGSITVNRGWGIYENIPVDAPAVTLTFFNDRLQTWRLQGRWR